MKAVCLASEVVRAALAAVLLVLAFSTALVAGQATVQYSKFLMFLDLLDQSGGLSNEYSAADGDLCQLKGIKCENGEVVVINFSNRGLVGELIKDNYVYENLPLVRNLNLRGNQLGYGVAPIPNNIAKLKNLNYFHVSGAQPQTITLGCRDLSNNAFSGEMPTFTISATSDAFKKITHIDLSNNQLRGRLRWNWGQLPSSTGYINLSGNQLSGALPEAWYQEGGLQGIDTLDVSRNKQDLCGDGGGQTQASEAFAARGVTFSCKADGSDGPVPGLPATPTTVAPNNTPQPLFDEDGEPIQGPDGDQIFIGPDGQPLVDADGNSIVDENGNPESDVHGNPVATNPDGTPKTDPSGAPIFLDSDGDELVAPDGTSLHGPTGHFTQDANGNPAAVGPDGQPVTDPDGNPVFVGPDGTPLVTPDGSSQTGTDGQPVQDSSGNPVVVDEDGDPVLDPDGNPVFQGPSGPLVDANGTSVVGPDGDVTTDTNGNPAATTPDGQPIADPDGDPIFVGPGGTPLVDDNGDSIIGPDGNITTDVDGNPVATNPDGTIKTDDNGNPIFIGEDGNPIVDEDGQSTRGWNGSPLTDEDGNEIPPAIFAPNGTVIPGGSLGGDPVFDADGNPIFDSNGNPVVIPNGGKTPPPANTTVGGAPWEHGNDTALPNGDPAGDLEPPSCASPLPFQDPLPSCSDPEAVAVCLSPDQLVLNTTALAANGTLPPNLFGCDARVTSQTFFHQFFPGQTKQGAQAREEETLDRMRSAVSGNKPVSVVQWTAVYAEAPAPTPAPTPEEEAPGPGSSIGATAIGTAALVDGAQTRRMLTRWGSGTMPVAMPEDYSLSVRAAQRALQQEGQDPIGVMGYFLVVGGTLDDLQSLVQEFSGVGQTIGEDGTPFLTQRQTSEQPDCGGTNTARTVLLSTLAVCIGALLAGLVLALYTIARIRKKPRHGHSEAMGMTDGASNTTITPSHTRGAWSEHDLAAVSPGSGQRPASGSSSPAVSGGAGERMGLLPGSFGSVSGKMAPAASFGSVMGTTVKFGEEVDSPRSSNRDNDGASQASLGKSVLTLRDGMGGRKASGHFPSGSWHSSGALEAGLREGSLQRPQSQDSDGGYASPLADRNDLQKSSDSSSGGSGGGSGGDGSGVASGHTTTAANVAASGSASGRDGSSSPEHEFVSVNRPLSPIAEHITHSEINSETTSSTMGDGSRMGSSTAGMGNSTMGSSHAMPVRPGSGGSALGPQIRTAVVPYFICTGETLAAESSFLEPTSTSIMSQSQYDESSAVVPQKESIALSGAAVAAAGVAAVGAGVAGAAAASAAAAPDEEDADEQETFHSVQRTSLQDTAPREEAALASYEDVQPGSPSDTSKQPTFGAAAYPSQAPAARGLSSGGRRAESSSLDSGLASVTQLGSMGIADMSGPSSQMHSHHSQQGAVLPSSQASSVDYREDMSHQHRTDPTGRSLSDTPGMFTGASFPGASSSFMFHSKLDGVIDRMGPDAHVDTAQISSMSMLDSFPQYSMGARVLKPTAEEPCEGDDYGDDEGDVEVNVDITHQAHTVGYAGGHASEIGVDGSSLGHLASVPYNPLLENSTSIGLGGDASHSHMQSLGNPRLDAPGPSGVLRQAYDLVDSMGQVADHTVLPPDHLDTGVMISVPQRPTNGSPGSSAQNLDFVAAQYRPDSEGPGPQLPAPTAGDSAENHYPARVPSVVSSEEATGRLEVPTSLEEMIMASTHEESQFRSIGSLALYGSNGNSIASTHNSTHNFRSSQE